MRQRPGLEIPASLKLKVHVFTSGIGLSSSVMSYGRCVSAIREDNPDWRRPRRGLRVLHRSAGAGFADAGPPGIAVAGTHGKTTTTAMIAHV